MLAKKFRLPIQLFFSASGGKKSGKSIKSRYFLLKIFPSNLTYSRFGIVVSTKVSKKATERNHLKRLIFNFLREKRVSLPIFDYLFILYPSIASATKKQITEELKKVLSFSF